MGFWPFRSKQPRLQDGAMEDLSLMFLDDTKNPTPGRELLDRPRFDFSVESLAAMDEHLERMRKRDLEGEDLLRFVLRAGAYVGEVIRRHTPPPKQWHWLDFKDAARLSPMIKSLGEGLGTLVILWDGQDEVTFPLGKVGKYLENGSEDSVRFYAMVIISGEIGRGEQR